MDCDNPNRLHPLQSGTFSADRDAMNKTTQPIVIKKYSTRRLYNTATRDYITLDDIVAMVKSGDDFIVRDAKTKKDITRSVLIRVIVEQEKKVDHNLLPTSFLRHLIRFYGAGMQMLVSRYLEISMNLIAPANDKDEVK